MADFKDLNAVHQKQMTDYLRFFRQKVNENVIEIEHAFDDTKDMTYVGVTLHLFFIYVCVLSVCI